MLVPPQQECNGKTPAGPETPKGAGRAAATAVASELTSSTAWRFEKTEICRAPTTSAISDVTPAQRVSLPLWETRDVEYSPVKRENFTKLVEETLDTLPAKFRELARNVVVVVEDYPPPDEHGLVDEELMGIFDGVPTTEKSVWDTAPPDRVILYQRNIEGYAADAAAEENRPVEEIIHEEVRLTVLHELGHFFGMDEDQLEDV